MLTDDAASFDGHPQHMRNMCTALLLAFVACSSNNTPADASVDAFYSQCGEPGDMGNAQGIGKFCMTSNDCPSTAPLCSTLGSKTTFFCTITCTFGSDACGTGATCTCQDGGSAGPCGCTPNSCLGSD